MRAGILGLVFLAVVLAASPAGAALRVVATTSDLAALASAVGAASRWEKRNTGATTPPRPN